MKAWQSDDELAAVARHELFTAVVGDVMDRMGMLHQFLPPTIRPLHPDMVVFGRAMPVLEADVYEAGALATASPSLALPFGLMLQALDDLKAGEVYICTGGSPRYALWGELMSTRAQMLGAAGVVLDGYYRDTKEIMALAFPTFGYGGYAQDQGLRGKVVDFRVPVAIGQVSIQPGDFVFGDVDGVCIVPQAAADDVFQAAWAKVRGESQVREAIRSGMSASAAFRKFGVM